MKKCIFTIVAKNYIGLGEILGSSIARFHDDVDFRIFVADEFDTQPSQLPDNVIVTRNLLGYSNDEWEDMAFKYDLTEFCTAIKPACFQYVFEQGYDRALYMDPDTFAFASLQPIFQVLDTYDVALTPQIARIHIHYTGEHPEWAMNVNGIFNLGFCGMANTPITQQVLQWWRLRLKKECFTDRCVGDFTDQKWMDWMPGFLGNDHLYVFHQLGMNMAPWNFFERELIEKDGQIMVRLRTDDGSKDEEPLLFMHFAGYDYEQMKHGVVARKRIENLKEYADLAIATNIYRDALVAQRDVFDSFIQNTYSYGTYTDGTPITSFHRRLYHGLSQEQEIKHPFSTDKASFYAMARRKGMLTGGNVDKLTHRNMPNIDRKRRQIALLFSALYRLAGYKRYVLFVKSLYDYCRPELHTFLIKKK